MVALDRFKAGDARQDELAAAAVTGKEMGRNAVDDDDFVGVDDVFIEFQWCAELGRTEVDESRIHAVVLIGLDAADDFFAADEDVFFRRLGAVRALGKDDVDVVIGDAGQVQFVDDIDKELIGMVPRAGDVGDDEADLIAFLDFFLQRGAADRMTHAVDRRLFDVDCRDVFPFHDPDNVFFRELDSLRSFTNIKSKFL